MRLPSFPAFARPGRDGPGGRLRGVLRQQPAHRGPGGEGLERLRAVRFGVAHGRRSSSSRVATSSRAARTSSCCAPAFARLRTAFW